ncbi:MAG TPA: hypothetical protein VGY55_19685 [Pirellulales bacterium]|jgi:hypothetical protein|nr:hypothetical protein [Pirellulales bacterium]
MAIPALLFLGCIASGADDSKVLQSKDKRVQIILPEGWETTVLAGVLERHIQAKSPDKGAFLVVISEPKGDLKFKSLREYADATMRMAREKKKIEDRTETGPKELKINGADAIQYEVSGTTKNVKVRFLDTYIETTTRWNQVNTWTTPSHWDETQDDFRAIYQSLTEQPKSP